MQHTDWWLACHSAHCRLLLGQGSVANEVAAVHCSACRLLSDRSAAVPTPRLCKAAAGRGESMRAPFCGEAQRTVLWRLAVL